MLLRYARRDQPGLTAMEKLGYAHVAWVSACNRIWRKTDVVLLTGMGGVPEHTFSR